jgi:hypothetical protein
MYYDAIANTTWIWIIEICHFLIMLLTASGQNQKKNRRKKKIKIKIFTDAVALSLLV